MKILPVNPKTNKYKKLLFEKVKEAIEIILEKNLYGLEKLKLLKKENEELENKKNKKIN